MMTHTANPGEARKLWFATMGGPDARKCIGLLENIEDPRERCFLGHACHALGVKRIIAPVDDEDRVFYGAEHPVWGDCELPPEAARALNITTTGELRKTLTFPDRAGKPIEVRSVSELSDQSAMTPQEGAVWLERNQDLLKPYRRTEHEPLSEERNPAEPRPR